MRPSLKDEAVSMKKKEGRAILDRVEGDSKLLHTKGQVKRGNLRNWTGGS